MNFKDYIKGQRHGKEANQLERQSTDDPFLQDAIDGYDSVEGDHLSVIEKLEKRVSPTRRGISRPLWIWAAVALIVLLTGIPLLLLPPGTKEEVKVASSKKNQIEKEIAPPAAPKDSVLMADNSGQPPAGHPPVVVDEEMVESIEPVVEITVNEETEVSTVQQAVSTKSDLRRSKENNEQLLASGRVVDETGEPLIGATILLRNSSLGAVTDMDGKFRLKVPANADSTLLASFIGMKPKEIPVKENVGDITLQSDDLALNEVVVVAFGTQKKERIVGSVTRIDSVLKKDAAEQTRAAGTTDSITNRIKTTRTYRPPFGNEEFIGYFRKNYDKKICEGQPVAFAVTFFIDSYGHPGSIHIKENSCPAMETEIKRLLLGSPLWSEGNREVTLKIKL